MDTAAQERLMTGGSTPEINRFLLYKSYHPAQCLRGKNFTATGFETILLTDFGASLLNKQCLLYL